MLPESLPCGRGASARLVPIRALGTAAPSNNRHFSAPGWSSPQGSGQGQAGDCRSEPMPSQRSWETQRKGGEGRQQIRSRESIIPNNKSSQGGPRQACF